MRLTIKQRLLSSVQLGDVGADYRGSGRTLKTCLVDFIEALQGISVLIISSSPMKQMSENSIGFLTILKASTITTPRLLLLHLLVYASQSSVKIAEQGVQ